MIYKKRISVLGLRGFQDLTAATICVRAQEVAGRGKLQAGGGGRVGDRKQSGCGQRQWMIAKRQSANSSFNDAGFLWWPTVRTLWPFPQS